MRKSIRNIIAVCTIIVCLYFIADVTNFPSFVGINVFALNWNVASIVIGNIIIIGLFLSTYFLFDKRNITKENNQREIAVLTLQLVYDTCREMIDLFSNDATAENAAKKCDFNKLEFQDPIMQQYLNIPFDNHADIVGFAKSGVITAKEYGSYLKIRKNYKSHIRMKIAFFDCKDFSCYKKKELISHIQNEQKGLKSKKEV